MRVLGDRLDAFELEQRAAERHVLLHSELNELLHAVDLRQPAHGVELVAVAKRLLLVVAEGLTHRIARGARDLGLRVGEGLAVLNIETIDRGESSRVTVTLRQELRDHRHLLRRVNGLARPVEAGVAHAVRVEVAAVRVAILPVARGRVGAAAAAVAVALGERHDVARVRRVGRRDGVGLPHVHLRAARAVLARPGIRIVGARSPARSIGLGVEGSSQPSSRWNSKDHLTWPAINFRSCGHCESQ